MIGNLLRLRSGEVNVSTRWPVRRSRFAAYPKLSREIDSVKCTKAIVRLHRMALVAASILAGGNSTRPGVAPRDFALLRLLGDPDRLFANGFDGAAF